MTPVVRVIATKAPDPALATPALTSQKYKTEFCNCYAEFGHCDYGEKCQFVHSPRELQPAVRRKSNQAPALCPDYVKTGFCFYGRRCNCLHQSLDGLSFDMTRPALDMTSSESLVARYNRQLRESYRDADSRISINPSTSRPQLRFSDLCLAEVDTSASTPASLKSSESSEAHSLHDYV